jgi:hypothetical protein
MEEKMESEYAAPTAGQFRRAILDRGLRGPVKGAAAISQASCIGAVAVLLAGQRSDDNALATAVSIAQESRARLSIFAVPRRVPLGACCVTFGFATPFSPVTLRAEALLDAVASATRAIDSVPLDIPTEYVVVRGSPVRAVDTLLERKAVAHMVVDRALLLRRPRLRLASDRWARDGMVLKLI